MLETPLYSPVKGFLEKLGFSVKGEIGGCDLLALSRDSPPIVLICELKLKVTYPALKRRGFHAKRLP
jgi:hypothetical protein